MNSTIVVGSDGSAPSRSALMWAAQRACALGMRIALCHVIDEEWAGLDQGPVKPGVSILAGLEAEAEIARYSFPTVDISCLVHEGRPIVVLADLARDADLLVMGTHKTGFIQGRAFESRFAGLAASLGSAVAFIPDSVTTHRRGVVAGIGRAHSNVMLRRAAAEARRFGDPLTLLGSWDGVPASQSPVDSARERSIAAIVDRLLEQPSNFVATEYPELAVRRRNVHRGAADALIDASLSARLLVIGSSADPSRESVIHDVLLNLSCPTIIVDELGLLGASAHRSSNGASSLVESCS